MTRSVRLRAGLLGLVTGIAGMLSALVLLFWPPQVSEDVFSYPFGTFGFLVAQVWFAVHHLGLLALLIALALSPAIGVGRPARGGAWLAAAGMLLLSSVELLATRYAEWDTDEANAGLIGSSYGVACTAIGLGMVAAGIGVLRTRTWSGWHAWTALLIGVSQFAVLTPGMFGGFVLARLAIGFWMLTFAVLGWSMYAQARREPLVAGPRADQLALPLARSSQG